MLRVMNESTRRNLWGVVKYYSITEGGFVTRQFGAPYLARKRVQAAHETGEVKRTPSLDPLPEGVDIRVCLRAVEGDVPECRNLHGCSIAYVKAMGNVIEFPLDKRVLSAARAAEKGTKWQNVLRSIGL